MGEPTVAASARDQSTAPAASHRPPRGRGQSRPPELPSESRCARYTGTMESTIRIAATTLTTGAWLGRNRLSKIHSGKVCRPGAVVKVRHHDLVEGQREGEQRAGQQR